MAKDKPIRAERRHNIRINASFHIEIVGVDVQPAIRRGNISVSGIYFEYDQDVGQPGSVCRLRIAASEGGEIVDVMTRVVRVVSYKDLWKGAIVAGLAFEFMLQNAQQQEEIGRLIKAAAELQIKRARGLQVDYPLGARVDIEEQNRQQATLRSLNLDGMTLETDWPVRVGETIHLVIEAPESKREIRLNGRVRRSDSLADGDSVRYAHVVDFSESSTPGKRPDQGLGPTEGPKGYTIADAVDGLLAEIITAHPESPRVDPRLPFCGRLSQVTLPSLLVFLEIERVSGTLRLEQKEHQAMLFLSQGRVIDIESNTPASEIQQILAELITWDDAIFEFNSQTVDREEKIDLSTSELLADLPPIPPDTTSK